MHMEAALIGSLDLRKSLSIDNAIDCYLVLNCKAFCHIGLFVVIQFIKDYVARDIMRANYAFNLSFRQIH